VLGLEVRSLESGTVLQGCNTGWELRLGIINDLYSVHRTHLHLLVPDHATEKLLSRFSNDTEMTAIIRWLLFLELAEDLTKRERDAIKKRADEYFIKNGKLWRLRKGAGHAVECLSREEGLATTLQKHEEIGHWAHDILTLELQRHYDWPSLQQDCTDVPSQCSSCQQFGPRLKNFLLQPIIRLRLFDMIAADYLKLPRGIGGFSDTLIFVDFFTCYVWGVILKRS
jgi:Integrase zinc binding domain